MSDLNETSYKQDKTSSQTISLIDESNCYITKQGLTKLKSRLVGDYLQFQPRKLCTGWTTSQWFSRCKVARHYVAV